MSNIAHPHPDPPPLRALRALQGRGKFGVAIQIYVDNRILNRSQRIRAVYPFSSLSLRSERKRWEGNNIHNFAATALSRRIIRIRCGTAVSQHPRPTPALPASHPLRLQSGASRRVARPTRHAARLHKKTAAFPPARCNTRWRPTTGHAAGAVAHLPAVGRAVAIFHPAL